MTTPDAGAADDVRKRDSETARTTQTGDIVRRAMPVRAAPETFDTETRSVDLVISTGASVRRRDFFTGEEFDEELVISRDAVRMDRLNRGAPLLDSHFNFSLSGVLGAVVPGSARIEDGALIARVQFSQREDVAAIIQDVADGIIRNVSVGYLIHKFEVDETTSPPTRRATDWEPFEVSLVPIGADPNAGVRAAHRAQPANHEEEESMPAARKEAGGKPAQTDTVSTEETRAAPETATSETRGAASAPQARQSDVATVPNLDEVRERVRAEERERIAGIREVARKLGLSDDFAERHINDGTSLDRFRSLAIDERASAAETEGSDMGNGHIIPDGARISVSERELEPGEMVGRIIRVLAAARCNVRDAREIAAREWKDPLLARAMAASVGSAGGFMVPEQYSSELIEFLRAGAVVRTLNPVTVPMPGGNLTLPKITGGGSASYVGENQNIAKTEAKVGQIRFSARKLAALVPISNDLIRFSSPQADAVVRDDLVAALAEREDLAFIRDDGTQDAPKGLRYWAPSANVIAANSTVNLANVTSDLGKLVLALKGAKVRMLRPGWILSPRTEQYLMTVRDGNGNYVFRDEMLRGNLWGWPFGVSAQIPENLGAGNDESEVYLVDFADAVIAEVPGLIIDVSSEAAYFDGTNVVAAFSLDQTVIRVIEQHDFGLRHDASVAVLTGVTWAP